ncbi:putative hydroxyacyl glutathione hydrolase [Gaertneriomyces semiglobifer]|nr:putative hydroxyacyl glutathione hydrolase [Gaertneriomyces semiglobifer]
MKFAASRVLVAKLISKRSFSSRTVSAMKITPIPCLGDNYSYLIIDDLGTNKAAVVDPVEPHKVLPVVDKSGAALTGIITTHHHLDHAGGNEELLRNRSGLKVWGGDDRIYGLTDNVRDEQKFKMGNLEVTPLFTPCHTSGSICFYVVDPKSGEKAVFTGDTLFIAGCGRFFEGGAKEMHEALIDTLGKLPKDTKVYCGHEYTKSNLKFAQHVEPSNEVVTQKLVWCDSHPCTVPSTIGEEFEINPFMRVNMPAVRKAAGLSDDASAIEVMGTLRTMKNQFK